MSDAHIRPVLSGRRALVVDVANEPIDIMNVGFPCAYLATFAKRLTVAPSSWTKA
jgi:hypothetical protein